MRSVKNSPFLGQYSANFLYSLHPAVGVPIRVFVCSDNSFISLSIVYSNLVLIRFEKQNKGGLLPPLPFLFYLLHCLNESEKLTFP